MENRSKHKYPVLQHPDRYVWDFWYYFEKQTSDFHLFFLNADPVLVKENKHHEAAQVGYGVTRDFLEIEWYSTNILSANSTRWDNTSVWSGDIIRINNGFLLFYTSRDGRLDDGFTQNIGVAYSGKIDTDHWQPIPDFRIIPDNEYYEPCSVAADTTIHAWRDPFLFREKDRTFMLVSAKSKRQVTGRKGAIGLLRSRDNNLQKWDYLKPIFDPGYYSEQEVPQLYKDVSGNYVLVYSTLAKFDYTPTSNKLGGMHEVRATGITGYRRNDIRVLLPYSSGLYAGRIIPEIEGEIVGFDIATGGIRRSGVKTGLISLNRDFTAQSVDIP